MLALVPNSPYIVLKCVIYIKGYLLIQAKVELNLRKFCLAAGITNV